MSTVFSNQVFKIYLFILFGSIRERRQKNFGEGQLLMVCVCLERYT